MTPEQKAKILVEGILGYSLDKTKRLFNQYEQTGTSSADCACVFTTGSVTVAELDPEFSFRLFPYNSKDTYLQIDPATEINSILLVKGSVTYQTLDPDEYRPHYQNGIIKYIEQCNRFCACKSYCDCVQLAVDANWIYQGCIPDELQLVIDEISAWYALGVNANIKKQTLGTHSYELADSNPPWQRTYFRSILKKWAGPNGSLYTMPVA